MDLPEGLYLRMQADERGMDVAADVLAPEERTLLQTFHLEKRRRQFVLGRLVLRQLLADHLGEDPSRVPLVIASDGAVDLAESAWRLSLAHSGDRAVAAVSTQGPVGVDIERIQPRHPGLRGFLLHQDEYSLVEGADPDDRLILLWTIKEAVLKGMRTGFRVSPRALRVRMDEARREAVVVVDDGAEWHARFMKYDAFYVSVAFPAAAQP